jgi:curli biogenesis system outer membrane secretion channel CsgG
MKNTNLKTAATFAMACALALPMCQAASGIGAGDEVYRNLSMQIVTYANTRNINKIIMTGFAAGDGAEKGEAEYISAKITAQLGVQTTPVLIEKSFFEKVLLEARASSAANSSPDRRKTLRDLLSVDAVVTGTVQAAGGKLKIQARLVDIKTGKVLFMTEGEAERGMEMPGILVADSSFKRDTAVQPSPSAGFRDSISGSQEKSTQE